MNEQLQYYQCFNCKKYKVKQHPVNLVYMCEHCSITFNDRHLVINNLTLKKKPKNDVDIEAFKREIDDYELKLNWT